MGWGMVTGEDGGKDGDVDGGGDGDGDDDGVGGGGDGEAFLMTPMFLALLRFRSHRSGIGVVEVESAAHSFCQNDGPAFKI